MPEDKNNKLLLKINNLPRKPGVYQFKNAEGKVIYVGKAKMLRNRVKQYFQAADNMQTQRISVMTSKISDVEVIQTDTEVEALILELNLIKNLKPKYNVNFKDDKSYPYIVITNELFPRIFPTRRKRTDGSRYFGPFTDVKAARYALKSIRDIFTVRSCRLNLTKRNIEAGKFKVCLDYHIKKCDGPCEGLIGADEYNAMIKQVAKLLDGKTASVIREFEMRMSEFAKQEKYEQAAALRDKIESVKVYSSKQKMVTEDIIDRDIFAVSTEDNDACGMILKIRDGKVIGKSHYFLSNAADNRENEILEKLLVNYYTKSDFIPDEIFLNTGIESQDLIEKWLVKKRNTKVKISIPNKGDKAKLVAMVKANARLMLDELKLTRMKREYTIPSLEALKRDLRLDTLPDVIECFDISHIQGTDTVASMVVFETGKPRKSEYRRYKIESVLDETGKPDDFLSMREVIYRRFRRLLDENKRLPCLVVVDGGKGQLSSAVKVLDDIGIGIENRIKGPNADSSIAKINIIGLAKRLEEVYFPGDPDPHTFPKTSSGLKLLQRIRDEAHRFAVEYHRKLRNKRTIVSELQGIPGIGEKTARKLLGEIGSYEAVIEMFNKDKHSFEKLAGKRAAAAFENYLNN